jgi:DNA-binding transcriptional ArsR family regulator
MDAALKAIAEPRRRAILELVWDAERSAGDIAAHFTDVSRPAISQHLTVLKEAGLVDERRDGVRRLYRARPDALSELREYIESFWQLRLRDLKVVAEAEERSTHGADRTHLRGDA